MKYRWSTFGHDEALLQLERDLSEDNLAQAYLFLGPADIGKFTIARKLAGILQCEADFCHNCKNCVQVEKGQHLDTMEIVNNGESIKIEEVRNIIDRLQMTGQSRHKIILIDGLERMTREAANSFLKILEEPPAATVFIMTSLSVNLLLPTVVSRTRILKFRTSKPSAVAARLKASFPEISDQNVDQIILFCGGKMGLAMRLAKNPEILADILKTFHTAERFLNGGELAEKFAYIAEIAEDSAKTREFLEMLLLVLGARMRNGEVTSEKAKDLLKITEAGMLLKKNVNTKLVLENLMLSI